MFYWGWWVNQACGSGIRIRSIITDLELLRWVEEEFKGKWLGNAEVQRSGGMFDSD